MRDRRGIDTMPRPKKKPNESPAQYDDIQILEVLWNDAVEDGDIGWNDLKEMLRSSKKPCPVMHTLGYLAYSDDHQISLLSTLGPEECSRLDKIPRAWILRETVIRPGTSLTNRSKRT